MKILRLLTLSILGFLSIAATSSSSEIVGVSCYDTGHFGSLNVAAVPTGASYSIDVSGWELVHVSRDLGLGFGFEVYSFKFSVPKDNCLFSQNTAAAFICQTTGTSEVTVTDYDGVELGRVHLRQAQVGISQISKTGFLHGATETTREGLQFTFSFLMNDTDHRSKKSQDYLYGGECELITN